MRGGEGDGASGRPGRPRGRRVALAWALAGVWALVVLGLSSEHFGADETAGWLGALVQTLLPGLDAGALGALNAAARKGAHVFEYAVLAALVFRALRVSAPRTLPARRSAALALVLAATLAVLDEGRQSQLPGRSGRASDVALDVAGAGAGVLVAAAWWRRRPARGEAVEPAP